MDQNSSEYGHFLLSEIRSCLQTFYLEFNDLFKHEKKQIGLLA